MRKRYMRLVASVIIVALGAISLASADAASADLSRAYHTSVSIHNGSIVSLDPQHSGYVEPATTDNGARLVGVIVASQDSLLAIDTANSTVQVAISGSVNALVSSVNGNIKVGDQISVSPFDGVGIEAVPGNHVIGVAQTAFDSSTEGATTEPVKDKSGVTHQLKIGYVRLAIAISNGSGTGLGGSQANFLQKLIKSLTGHTISTVRILLSLVVGMVVLVSLVTLIYASIHGSIISVGRNPLAKSAIFRTLTSVMVMALITVTVACVTIYYLLR